MDRMSEIINEYKSNQWDETKLVTLIDLRRELACLIYELSKKVREAAINYSHAYANRRVETARFKIEHLTNKDTLGMSKQRQQLTLEITEQVKLNTRGITEVVRVYKILLTVYLKAWSRIYLSIKNYTINQSSQISLRKQNDR